MEVIGQDHASTTLPSEKEAWWISELVWTIYSKAKHLASPRI
jgi:hypothetical protein